MGSIDLRSDTLTQPTDAMRQAMANAVVGDDVMGEDPTVNQLESKMAKAFGKEAALFVPSGSMGNLISLLTHCQLRGSEIIVGKEAHIHKYEAGSYAQFGGIAATCLPNNADGTIDLDMVLKSIRNSSDHHQSTTRVLCLETTQNNCGGKVLPIQYIQKARELCNKEGLKLHLDGARLMNACVKMNLPPSDLLQYFDSVSMCFSKGLGAPVGSIVAGTQSFIDNGRKTRKALGGGMRQCGILAAACIMAFDNAQQTISRDHQLAQQIYQGLSSLSYEKVQAEPVHTNIILINCLDGNADQIVQMLQDGDDSVACFATYPTKIRWVAHLNVGEEDGKKAVNKLNRVLKKIYG